MRSTWVWLLAAVLVGAAACGGGGQAGSRPDTAGSGGSGTVPADGGGADAGADAGTGAGTDAGTDGGTDAGTPDAGSDGGVSIVIPNAAGWTFHHAQDGLISTQVMGASADEGGNLWVAGGKSGVFVLRKGQTSFQRFTLADGLHPFGYLADGSPADTDPYLEAISIAGGPAGTAFVGYMGKPPPAGHLACEDNWDSDATPDPAIYKSGDADKVTLKATGGLDVVHYDIFSGPFVVPAELRGREKLCNVFRIVYEHGTRNVWFGANHGFAWGHADFAGDPTCDGEYPGNVNSPLHVNCAGVWEHVHPAISGSLGEVLTGDYYGVALDLVQPHDVWFGGIIRTTRFKFGELGDYYLAETATENDASNKIDVWPDQVPDNPSRGQRKDDVVSGIVALPDGSILVGSFAWGVRHLSRSGALIGDVGGLQDPHVTALARDPEDGSVWVGYTGFGFGVSQIMPDGTVRHYNSQTLGSSLSNSAVTDIQVDTFTRTVDPSVKHDRVIVSFRDGVVGVFTAP